MQVFFSTESTKKILIETDRDEKNSTGIIKTVQTKFLFVLFFGNEMIVQQ
jgi:hypothetical protein